MPASHLQVSRQTWPRVPLFSLVLVRVTGRIEQGGVEVVRVEDDLAIVRRAHAGRCDDEVAGTLHEHQDVVRGDLANGAHHLTTLLQIHLRSELHREVLHAQRLPPSRATGESYESSYAPSVIGTQRLHLRAWRDDDLEPFAAMSADPAVMEHFPSLLDHARAAEVMGRIRGHFEREGFGLWAVEVPGVAPFIGFTGIARVPFRNPWIEVGWRLARAHWGQGYASEAARAAVDWGFANLAVDEIVAMTVPANLRSQRVMAGLGMVRDPAADFEHPSIPEGSPLRPHWLFRLPRPR
jgi:RimJ/RimL family protein N-acetyltransferase